MRCHLILSFGDTLYIYPYVCRVHLRRNFTSSLAFYIWSIILADSKVLLSIMYHLFVSFPFLSRVIRKVFGQGNFRQHFYVANSRAVESPKWTRHTCAADQSLWSSTVSSSSLTYNYSPFEFSSLHQGGLMGYFSEGPYCHLY